MNAQTRIEAARPDIRDRLLDAQLCAIRCQGMAKRAAWALEGLCNKAAEQGVDVAYYRALAADIGRRAEVEDVS